MASPGASSVPANSEPIITESAPAAIALVTSPENFMPPSAIIGTPEPFAALTHSSMAVICGTPAPVTTRVVQILPGPIPTLIASTPASINAFVASAVATLPAIISAFGILLTLIFLIASMTPRLNVRAPYQ